MMDFELPRSFVAVAECGGFHRAAAFGFARRSAHCASRKRIGPADRLIVYTSPSLTGVRAAALAGLAITPLPATAPTSCRKNLPKSPSGTSRASNRRRPTASAERRKRDREGDRGISDHESRAAETA